MKKIMSIIAITAIAAFAGCNSYGSGTYHSTNCYNNGTRQTWDTFKTGNMTQTYYNNSNGVRGTTNQFNYSNGNYHRTYTNNNGYRSTTEKVGNCYFFRDNQGNSRTKCY